MEFAVVGTDTGVGKTWVTALLARALRAHGRRVWLHKPIACGGWQDGTAEDARALRALCADGQDPASICPWEFPEPCSPHLAAAASGATVTAAALTHAISACRGADHDLLVEGIGGLLTPLTSARESLADLLPAWGLPALLVTRPDLGTLNHTALTVRVARAAGIRLLGLVLNHQRPPADTLAERTAADELALITGLPLLAVIPALGDHRAVGPELIRVLSACEPAA